MSQILKNLLQPKIKSVLTSFGSTEYTGDDNPSIAQDDFAEKLAGAIATGVQQYIRDSVVTIPAPGPVTHTHKMIAP